MQSDQRLCCLLPQYYYAYTCKIQNLRLLLISVTEQASLILTGRKFLKTGFIVCVSCILLQGDQTVGSTEATEAFFAMTKLFQSKDVSHDFKVIQFHDKKITKQLTYGAFS